VRRQDCRGEIGPLKSEKSRRDIPLSPGMARRLKIARASQAADERVFTSPQGFPLSDGNLRRRSARSGGRGCRPALGHVPHLPPHLRLAAVRGRPEWLGHADAGFTLKVYVHLMDAGVGDAAFMDEVVVPAAEEAGG